MIKTLDWRDIERATVAMADFLRAGPPVLGLVAVARGGLIPAALLAQHLDVRLIETIAVRSYQGRQAGAAQLLKPATVEDGGADWVIVDDLVDRGETARLVRGLLPKARLVCLYAKPAGRRAADWFSEEVAQDVWLEFPWERQIIWRSGAN